MCRAHARRGTRLCVGAERRARAHLSVSRLNPAAGRDTASVLTWPYALRVLQDYRLLKLDQLELLEKQTLRTIVQAVQQYSNEARMIFETTVAPSEQEVIVMAEDLVQYALEVAECYPIDRRFAGFIDYKRVRWLSSPFGIFPQVLLVDAKASTESNRETLQASQLPMDAEFRSKDGTIHAMPAGVPPHLELPTTNGQPLVALTTSVFIHFHYERAVNDAERERRLKDIFLLSLPHQLLKARYNPDADKTFYGQGKHSPARKEVPRIRVYFTRLRQMSPWRLQRLRYLDGQPYTLPVWWDTDEYGEPIGEPFDYIGRGASPI